jgi:hypothetical protein
MALTTEQQAQVDMQKAIDEGRYSSENKQRKLEALRMAKEILFENRRTKSAGDAVDITASAVSSLAADLDIFVNS